MVLSFSLFQGDSTFDNMGGCSGPVRHCANEELMMTSPLLPGSEPPKSLGRFRWQKKEAAAQAYQGETTQCHDIRWPAQSTPPPRRCLETFRVAAEGKCSVHQLSEAVKGVFSPSLAWRLPEQQQRGNAPFAGSVMLRGVGRRANGAPGKRCPWLLLSDPPATP